jgi:hypothetical protein
MTNNLPNISNRLSKLELIRRNNQSKEEPTDSENLFPVSDVHFNNHIKSIKSKQSLKLKELSSIKHQIDAKMHILQKRFTPEELG